MKEWKTGQIAHRLDKSIKNNDRKEEFCKIFPFLLTDSIARATVEMLCNMQEKRR